MLNKLKNFPLLVLGAVLAGAGLSGCGSLQNDVDVPLPFYPNQLVVECYLEDGKVPRLTVTESVPYLDNGQGVQSGSQAFTLPNGQQIQLPVDVSVTLTLPDGSKQPLNFRPGVALEDGSEVPAAQLERLNRDSLTYKLFTHTGSRPISAQPGQQFGLEVSDQRGRRVTGSAVMPARVRIDSLNYRFDDRRKALVLANFFDQPTEDFYRFMIHKKRITRSPTVDMDVQDRLNNGRAFTLGTSFRFDAGDTLVVSLFHLDRPYYSFRTSTREARNANGNPFSQPSAIRSTVQGGLGVFTVLSYDREQLILK